jgi:hypothetical protein
LALIKTVSELREMIKSRTGIDPLWDFGEPARDELQTPNEYRGL